jgi:molybdenum cofactor cytidylyltransferase
MEASFFLIAMNLQAAFQLGNGPELISLVGGGGKTSLMFALARALPGRVVTTTTTRMFAAQTALAPAVCRAHDLEVLGPALARYGSCLVVGDEVENEKVSGVDPALPGEWLARPDVDFVLVEADGARRRPIKAPAAHEPVLPPRTTLLVPVVGIDALDGRIRDVAHRPQMVCRLLNEGHQSSVISDQLSVISHQWRVDDRLTVEAVAVLLAHRQGGLKGAPDSARVIPFLNKVENADRLAAARRIAQLVLHESRIERVLIGAVHSQTPVQEVQQRVTAVVLAAGEAKRMGQTKQLLPWGETTVLGQTLRNLGQTAVHDILVVTGHEAAAVAAEAITHGVATIHNPEYATGEMLSSLQTAVAQLSQNRAAVLVMLADQPMVTAQTIDRLLAAYWQGESELIAPVYEGQRGNPVLIGRSYFDELLALPVGSAPRALLRRHRPQLYLVPVDSDAVLRDLDRPEEYERWRPSDSDR